jgi:magnesium transporter
MSDSEDQNQPQNDRIHVQTHNGVSWVDVHNPDSAVFEILRQEYHLHPVHMSESIQKVQHTQVERENEYLFFVLHFPAFDQTSGKILIGQLAIFLGKDYLITIRTSDCPVVTNMFEATMHETETGGGQFSKGSGHLLYALIGRLLSNISEMTDVVVSELDGIEDIVFDNNDSDAQRIGKVRQKIVRLRRVIGPKRIILEDLTQQADSFLGDSVSMYYASNVKRVNKLWEVIEEAKETVEIYKDADFTTSTEKTNKVLTLLTLVFTFTIPITVVGTLYGMNVLLPGGVEAGHWTFLGRYTSFVIIVAISGLLAMGMYFYFKRKKWF